jgi:hypothetical protein
MVNVAICDRPTEVKMDLEIDETYLGLAQEYVAIKERAFETGSHDDMREASEIWLELHCYMNPHRDLKEIILDLITAEFKRQHQLFLKSGGASND